MVALLLCGHAIGSSGARVLTTLAYALQRENKRYGIASVLYWVVLVWLSSWKT